MEGSVSRTEETAVGPLRALTWSPGRPGPGIVLVDGSGPGTCEDWGGWAERIAELGVVVLAHDRPGCGGSPGDFLTQTLPERAAESRAALDVLRRHPDVTGPAGHLGVSQGGWVGMLAADTADFLVSVSGPGVGPRAQDRHRITVDLRTAGLPVEAALAWVDERSDRLAAGEDPVAVHADQRRHAAEPWYAVATADFDSPAMLAYLARLIGFEPAAVLPGVRCPALVLFGAADPLVDVPESVAAWVAHAPALAGLAVFPAAGHGLTVPGPGARPAERFAPGFLPMLAGFLSSIT
jgi:pimeloyl-ACP methyl ester carboxylesterase